MRRFPRSTSSICIVRIIFGRAAWTAAKAMMSRMSGVVAVAIVVSMSACSRAWMTPPGTAPCPRLMDLLAAAALRRHQEDYSALLRAPRAGHAAFFRSAAAPIE
jgi:hypothetical protein